MSNQWNDICLYTHIYILENISVIISTGSSETQRKHCDGEAQTLQRPLAEDININININIDININIVSSFHFSGDDQELSCCCWVWVIDWLFNLIMK